jgi:hypothetical protein
VRTPTFLAVSGALLAAPAYSAPLIPMSAAVKRDVQCFVLYSVAVNGAEASKNEKMKQAVSLGVMYFFGKVRTVAPDLNFAGAVRQVAEAFDTDPERETIGSACDAEFQKRGAELIALGQELQKPTP